MSSPRLETPAPAADGEDEVEREEAAPAKPRRGRKRDDEPRASDRSDERPREDRPREDRLREERSREDRPRGDRPRRDDRPGDDRPRDDERRPRRGDRDRNRRPREDDEPDNGWNGPMPDFLSVTLTS